MSTFGMNAGGTWYTVTSDRFKHHMVQTATRRGVKYSLHHNPSTGESWILRDRLSGTEVRKLPKNWDAAKRKWNDFIASLT